MMKKLWIAAILVALSGSILIAQQINTEASEVRILAWHGDGSEVKGTITGMQGEVNFDPQNPAEGSFKVCIAPKSIDTGNGMRNWHLKSKKYLRVKRYPAICFTSSEIKAVGEGFVAVGTLQIMESTREVELPFEFKDGVFTGKLDINRFDYGIDDDNEERVASKIEAKIKCVLED